MKKCEQGTNSSSCAKTPVSLGPRESRCAHEGFHFSRSNPWGSCRRRRPAETWPAHSSHRLPRPGRNRHRRRNVDGRTSVWYGALLRGDINRIIIGPRSNVQDNAVVHIDTPNETRLGELVTVGHSAIVHACIIDDEVLIGMGAIILDGAEIGARSIIGANALVTLGTKIPPGSLVLGSPAKVKRALTLEEQKDIARWAWSYVETSKHFREFYSR